MSVNEKSLENLDKGVRFSSENQPENRGRKPSALRFIRDEGISITDIKKIIGSLIWDYDAEELAALLKTVKVKVKGTNGEEKTITKTEIPIPMGINLILGALNSDLKSKNIDNFEKLMNRIHGKPIQALNVSGITNTIPEDPEKRRLLAEQIEKELKELDGTA